MTVALGLLSTARINAKVLAGARASGEIEVVAVASRDRSIANAYAREHGIPRAHGAYEELLADPAVEAVYVSLPNSLHVEWTLRSLEAGKHVLCEKPLSRRAADVEAAYDGAARAGRVLMEGFMFRHHPQTRRLVELLGAGAVGRPRVVRASFSIAVADAGDVRLRRALDGGALMDVGCYCVSAARMIAGEPEQVHGEQVVGGDGVDVVFVGSLRFPGEVLAHFDAGLLLPGREELEVVGEEGVLHLADPWLCRQPAIELRRGGRVERVAIEAADHYRLELENLAAAIRGSAPPLLGRDDAVGQARAIEALYRSAETTGGVALADLFGTGAAPAAESQ
jgi:D-xylose 1-dehydrogenase (NADP+, D-xylono-1,5-lactone-forming)